MIWAQRAIRVNYHPQLPNQLVVVSSQARTGFITANLTAYDERGHVSHSDRRQYPDISLLWENIGCQQNNRRTIRVKVQTDRGLEYDVVFPPWSSRRRFSPSARFQVLLYEWATQAAQKG
jgi:hypothetical protein